jgi:Ribbon-helix-helix protein, copG family
MRRIQIYIDEPTDDVLELEARRRGTSKAALIRRAVAKDYPQPPTERDPWDEVDGVFDGGDPIADIDEVIYGPRR